MCAYRSDIKDHHLDHIILNNGNSSKKYDLKSIFNKARKCQINKEQQVFNMCKKIVRELSDQEIIFNARQIKMMTRLIQAGLCLAHASGLNMFSEPDAVTAYITSVIPEIHGIVRTNVNPGMIRGTMRSIVSGFTLGDPVIIAGNIMDLCEVKITDSLSWVTAMKQMTDMEEDVDVLKQAAVKIKTLSKKGVIERELIENLFEHLMAQITVQTLIKEDVPVAQMLKRADEIVASI